MIGNLINNFLNNLYSLSSGTSGSVLPTTTNLAATGTVSVGTESITDAQNTLDCSTGTGVVSVGSALTGAGNNLGNLDANIVTTQAYVESMSDEELEQFIIKLEDKNIEFDMEDRSLKKTIDNKRI